MKLNCHSFSTSVWRRSVVETAFGRSPQSRWGSAAGWLMLAVTAIVCLAGPASSAAELFVSPHGQKGAAGTAAEPLASLAEALERVRAERAQAAPSAQPTAARQTPRPESWRIILLPGTHFLRETVVLTPADSGTAEAPLVIMGQRGASGEEVILSGGERLQLNWEAGEHGVWSAQTPPGTQLDQLFVNGQRQIMARYPNFDPQAQYYGGVAADAISPERVARWRNPAGGLIHAMHAAEWGDYHYLIQGKNAQNELQTIGGWQNNRQMGMHPERRFVENIREELDAPGEWFHDTHEQRLYYFPAAGVNLREARIETAKLPILIDFQGTAAAPVKHIKLRDVTCTHTARTFMENREPLLRSDWTTYRGGAIRLARAEHCGVYDCRFPSLGGNGIFVDGRNSHLEFVGNHIEEAGASGFSLVGHSSALRSPLFEYHQTQELDQMDRVPGPLNDEYPRDCLISDNLIVRTGRVEKQTAGVNICMAARITVRHNSIYEVPRAGINICDGTFGGHLIEGNDVFDTVLETGDHGSFNSWGRDRFWHPDRAVTEQWVAQHPDMPVWDCRETIVLRNNRWRCDHGWDIDLDDGSSNYLLTNNLCLAGGIKLREGYRRRVVNNIMVNYTFCPHVWYRDCDSRFEQNIIWLDHYATAGMNVADFAPYFDLNFVHVAGAKNVEPASGLRGEGRNDARSLRGDAQFVAPLQGDYRVSEDSPARRIGFHNFPMDQFGVRKPELKAIARTPALPGTLAAAAIRSGGWGRDYQTPDTADWQGATVKTLSDPNERSAVGLAADSGVLIQSIAPDSPAAQFGLQPLDVITAINGQRVRALADLLPLEKQATQQQLTIWRNQAEMTLELKAQPD